MSDSTVRGANGGNARAAKLTKEQRSAIAVMAAKKRWGKPKETIEIGMIAQAGNATTLDPANGMMEPKTEAIVFQAIPVSAPAAPPPRPPAPPTTTPTPSAPEPPKPPKSRRKPMVKEFGKAHSYAEKRLAEALKERAESMGKVAMLNAEIPSLVQIIKALGMTPNMNGFQDFTAQIPNMNPYQQPQYQQHQMSPVQDTNPIDPALYATNSNPVPGLSPAVANAPVVTNKPLGGAIDLDFTPTEDEGPPLPRMGGGWQ